MREKGGINYHLVNMFESFTHYEKPKGEGPGHSRFGSHRY